MGIVVMGTGTWVIAVIIPKYLSSENQNTKYEKKKARKLGGIFGTFGNNPYLCPRKQ